MREMNLYGLQQFFEYWCVFQEIEKQNQQIDEYDHNN